MIESSYCNLALAEQMTKTVISCMALETGSALWNALQPEVLFKPDKLMWKKTLINLKNFGNFYIALELLIKKHVQIQATSNSDSIFYNYKKNI